jgi:hypothetical protein
MCSLLLLLLFVLCFIFVLNMKTKINVLILIHASNIHHRLNIRLTMDSLIEFYAKYDTSKSESSIKELYGKCAKLSSASECEGGAASDLVNKLQKKYKAKPKLVSKSTDTGGDGGGDDDDTHEEKASAKKPPSSKKESSSRSSKKKSNEPNLDVATLEELEKAVAQRRADLGLPPVVEATSSNNNNDDDEDEEEEEEEEENPKKMWVRSTEPEKVVIIGSGPAGLAASIYAARAGLKPVVVAPPFGGQLMGKGVDVENYPGLLGQTGPGVVNLMIDQASHFGTVCYEVMS